VCAQRSQAKGSEFLVLVFFWDLGSGAKASAVDGHCATVAT